MINLSQMDNEDTSLNGKFRVLISLSAIYLPPLEMMILATQSGLMSPRGIFPYKRLV